MHNHVSDILRRAFDEKGLAPSGIPVMIPLFFEDPHGRKGIQKHSDPPLLSAYSLTQSLGIQTSFAEVRE